MDKKTLWWAAGVTLVVALALGLWAFAISQPLNTWTGVYSIEPWVPTIPAAEEGSAPSGGGIPTEVARAGTSVVALVESLPDSSEFQSLFKSTGVAAMIESGGQYTVFVPTNAAFARLPEGTISNMSGAELKRLVEYHVVAGTAIQGDDESAGVVEALSGDPLNFTDTNNIPMVGSALLAAEYKAGNGIVYVLNAVLLPPEK